MGRTQRVRLRANPADDTLRLVFADWLDERGDPLGEFVRVQLELDPVRDQLDNPRVAELEHREAVLLGTHGGDWLGAAADLDPEFPAFGPVFRRGLPEMVCVSLDAFLARGGELFAACPTVREVCLFGVSERGAELAACPHLNRIETLELCDPEYHDNLQASRAFFENVSAAHIHRVRLPAVCSGYQWLARIIATGWPRWVEFLNYIPEHTANRERFAPALDRLAGRPVASVVKLFETTFPLRGELKDGLLAGSGKGTSLLAAGRTLLDGTRRLLTCRFSPDGTLKSVAQHAPGRTVSDLDHLRATLGFELGLIRVREFHTAEGFAVHLWPRAYEDDYLRRTEPQPGSSEKAWRSRGGVLKRWLHDGRFVIEWGGHDYWADHTGTIISS